MPPTDDPAGLAVLVHSPAACPARDGRDPAREWAHAAAEPDWSAIAPRGFHARFGKPVLEGLLLAALLACSVLPALAVALGNLLVFRDPRKILYLQPRVGHRGKVFTIYKFRTMRDARQGEMSSWSNGGDHARVTRFGKWLRNVHLDELPQLLNVLRGDMRVIGPRPEMIEVDAWARARVPGFARRLAVRPGITGLAQVTQGYTGADVDAYARKLAIDENYIANLSLRLELTIVLRTVAWLLRGRGWNWNAG